MLQKLMLSKVLFLTIAWLVFTSFGNQTMTADKIPLKVASVCMKAVPDKQVNLQRFFSYMEEAAAQGAKLIVFPEVVLELNQCWGTSDYSPTPEEIENLYESAETVPGESTNKLIEKAKELKIYVIFGMTEKLVIFGMAEKIPDLTYYSTRVYSLDPTAYLGSIAKTTYGL